MRPIFSRALAVSIAWASAVGLGGDRPADAPRKVLVVVREGPGPASPDLLGRLPGLGLGDDRVVALRFPAEAAGPGRDGGVPEPKTVRVDGGQARPGPDDPGAIREIWRALEVPPGVVLKLDAEGSARVSAKGAGRDVVVGLAVTERSAAGGQVVRRIERRAIKLDRGGARSLPFPAAPEAGADPSGFRLAAFVEDRATGLVLQSDSIPRARPVVARGKPRRPGPHAHASLPGFDLGSMMTTMGSGPAAGSSDGDGGDGSCPACGSPYIPPPFGPIIVRPGQVFVGPPPTTC